MAAKLDMSKAYDRVEWGYLEAIMLKLGFHANWVRLVLKCINSVSYSIMLNGAPSVCFVPSRGLRQGDPLSPFLFLMCAEGLSALLRKAEPMNLLKGVEVCRGGPRVSHLMFADDCLLFFRANSQECLEVLNVLGIYEEVSGQKLNVDKKTLFFSANTDSNIKDALSAMLGTSISNSVEKYLGLPSVMGRSKIKAFEGVEEITGVERKALISSG